jgi:UDP-N-acetylglucosamine 1-carboxyvinyltransferase
MYYLSIQGNQKLSGSIKIDGAKNSALPIIASTILSKNNINITNVPNVADIKTLLKLLENLGANYTLVDDKINIDTNNISNTKATYDIVKTMRASILVLGPLLARFGHCQVSLPGGCAIGERPVDLHLMALEKMGAKIEIKSGYIDAKVDGCLKGATIVFDKITVTGTENIVMAAALANGTTKIINAAKEPEVVQLCKELQSAGVDIKGIGTDEIEVVGSNGKLLDFQNIKIIPDRIEAATYICAGAITNSKLTVTNVCAHDISAFLAKLEQMGFTFDINDDQITINPTNEIKAVDIITQEYPGFPTDIQAQFMALATQANGTSIIEERLFENRFMHAGELRRLGSNIHINGKIAKVTGKTELLGADVMATDLRASSALVLAALCAKGTTNVHRIYHLDRGYVKLEEKLSKVGAKITRLKEEN